MTTVWVPTVRSASTARVVPGGALGPPSCSRFADLMRRPWTASRRRLTHLWPVQLVVVRAFVGVAAAAVE